ncbi:MAG: glycosyltransferase family 4 protein [Rivularia sp. (in: cyanobacteria)]
MKDSTINSPSVALLPWGNVIEDYLDSINISIESFCTEMTGGWLFGYVEALKLVGINTVIICVSNRVSEITTHIHKPSGATIYILPASPLHGLARWLINPADGKLVKAFPWFKWLQYPFLRSLKDIEPLLATPLLSLKQVLQRENTQVILSQEYEYPRFDVCVLVGKWLKLPVYASFQGGNFQVSRLEGLIRPRTLKACNGLIVASQVEIERLHKNYGFPPEKIAQIFNPLDLKLWKSVDSPEIRSQIRNELGIPPEAQIVICHGRIDIRRKGLDILLSAWEQVYENYSLNQRPYLLLVGTGDDAIAFQQLIDERAVANIIWINKYILDRGLMIRYLSAADLYVLASRNEGFPVAPLEAMSCGLPIVATEVPGIPDILENYDSDGGIRVPCENANRLAEAISRLLNNEELRRELGKRARKKVEKRFSLLSVGEEIQSFIFPDK